MTEHEPQSEGRDDAAPDAWPRPTETSDQHAAAAWSGGIDRLLGEDTINRQPAGLAAEPVPVGAVGAARRESADSAVEAQSVAGDADIDDDDPDLTLDWAVVAPQYSPHTEEPGNRGRVLALLALVGVIGAMGIWLVFGPNAPRTGAAPNTKPGIVATVGSSPIVNAKVRFVGGTDVLVHQRVVLHEAMSSITLTIPDRSGTPSLRRFDPRVTQLDVRAADAPLDIHSQVLGVGDTLTVQFPKPTRHVTVVYRASGSVVASHPVRAGRGLVLATPVYADTGDITRSVAVTGPRFTNMFCARVGKAPTPCGDQSNMTWKVTQKLGDNTGDVLGQLDLPPGDHPSG